MLLACLELQDFGGVVIVIVIVIVILIVTGGKQSQLLVFWTWLGLEFDNIGHFVSKELKIGPGAHLQIFINKNPFSHPPIFTNKNLSK